MYDNRDNINFGESDIPQLFRNIFIPTVLGMLFNVAFSLTDGIFVGHGVGPAGLASVNLVCPVMMLITGLGLMFGIGSSVVAAIHLAKENVKAARINVTQAFITSGLIASILAILLYLFPNVILVWLGVSQELMTLAHEYYIWFIPTCLFLMFQIVGEFVIRLDGNPKFAMYANIIPAVVNIILDYTFIFPYHLGLKGAALATDIGTFIGMTMTLYYLFFRSRTLKPYKLKCTWTSLRLMARNVGYMEKMGFSAFVGEFAISVMILTGNLAFSKYLGDDGIAAYGVICYLFPVVFMIYTAVAQSAQPIISFNYGAGKSQRVTKTFWHSVLYSLVFGTAMTLVFCFCAPAIISIFVSKDAMAFNLAASGLPYYALGFLFIAFNLSAIGYFQSIEKAGVATFLTLLRGIILLIIAFQILPNLLGNIGLWLAVPAAELITCLIAIWMMVIRK